MKKLLVLLILFLIPGQVSACPHFDADGNMYLLYYDYEDYETTIIEYPKIKYNQLYFLNPDDDILKEQFEIPFFMSTWIDYEHDFFALIEEPYYIDFDQLEVEGEDFFLEIKVTNSQEIILPLVEEETTRLSYLINTKWINDELHQNILDRINQYTSDMPVTPLEYDVFYIGAKHGTMNQNWESDQAIINDFFDPIKIRMPMGELSDNFTIIKIESFDREKSVISEIDFTVEDDYIVFTAENSAYFQVVEADGEITPIEVINEDYDEEMKMFEIEDEKPNLLGVIILSAIAIIAFVIFLIYINKKQIKV